MQGSRVSCLPQVDFIAFGKGVQLISGSPYGENKRLSEPQLAKLCDRYQPFGMKPEIGYRAFVISENKER